MKQMTLWVTLAVVICISVGCESWDRTVKDFNSSVNGMQRTAQVYDQNGNVIKTYTGKFDVEVNEYGNKVKFDINGKRVLIYNATVVVEEQ
jgi:hypothetical protein